MLIYLRNPVNIIKHSSQDSILTYFQQRLRKVLRQFPTPCGISSRYYNTFHTLSLLFSSEHESLELHELKNLTFVLQFVRTSEVKQKPQLIVGGMKIIINLRPVSVV